MNFSAKKLILIACIACIIGTVFSVISHVHYLEFVYGVKQGPSFCNLSQSFDCDAITQSDWAALFGIPLAVYGLAFYLVFLFFSGYFLFIKESSLAVYSSVLLIFALLSSLFSIFLFYISEIVIGTLCLVCTAMYIANFILLVVSVLLCRERGLGASLLYGFRALFSFPKTLLGFCNIEGRKVTAQAQSALLGLIIALFLAFYFSELLITTLYLPEGSLLVYSPDLNPEDKEKALKQALWRWQRQELLDVKESGDAALTKDYRVGSKDAPIQVVEFSDYECPFCRSVFFVLEHLKNEYGDSVSVIFKNYPLDDECNPGIVTSYHKNACYAAYFTRCAGEQDKFWEASALFYEVKAQNHGMTSAAFRESFEKEASNLGLDVKAIKECVESKRYKDKILSDIAEGDRLNLQGTPMIIVNNKLVETPLEEILRKIFDSILEKNRAK